MGITKVAEMKLVALERRAYDLKGPTGDVRHWGGFNIGLSVDSTDAEHPIIWKIDVVVGGTVKRRKWDYVRAYDLDYAIQLANELLDKAEPVRESVPRERSKRGGHPWGSSYR
jgi:hypothetical protein